MNLYYRYNAAIFEEAWTSNSVIEFISRDERLPILHFGGIITCLALIYISELRILALFFLPAIFYSLWYIVTEESVTIMKDFGVQIKLKYFLAHEDIVFLHCDKIEGILLHECIKGHGVNFYLTFMIIDQPNLAVAFKDIYPGLEALQRIYFVCSTFLPDCVEGRHYARPSS